MLKKIVALITKIIDIFLIIVAFQLHPHTGRTWLKDTCSTKH